MRVKDLIKMLSEYNPNALVRIETNDALYPDIEICGVSSADGTKADCHLLHISSPTLRDNERVQM